MTKKLWGVYNKQKNTIVTTSKGVPVILPTRTAALAIVTNDKKNLKVVRVSVSLEHRLSNGRWSSIS